MSVAAPTGLTTAADVRDLAAVALAPVDDADPNVHADVVDSLTPPVLMMLKGDPWLTPGAGSGARTMGPCLWIARLEVLAVASRYEPGAGIRKTDELEAYVIERMKADPYVWPLDTVSGPRAIEWAKIAYLCSRVTYLVPVTV